MEDHPTECGCWYSPLEFAASTFSGNGVCLPVTGEETGESDAGGNPASSGSASMPWGDTSLYYTYARPSPPMSHRCVPCVAWDTTSWWCRGAQRAVSPSRSTEHASLLLQAWQGVNMLGFDRGIYPLGGSIAVWRVTLRPLQVSWPNSQIE